MLLDCAAGQAIGEEGGQEIGGRTMTISEYEFFGASEPNWRDRVQVFADKVHTQIRSLVHSHGDHIKSGSVPRTMRIGWAMKLYEETGEREFLEMAAAWIVAEWMDSG
jgi:hypothetical protein